MRKTLLISASLGLLVLLPTPSATATGGTTILGRMFPGPLAIPEVNPPECPPQSIVGRWFGGGYGVACFDPAAPTPQIHEIPDDQVDDLENQGMIVEPIGKSIDPWIND